MITPAPEKQQADAAIAERPHKHWGLRRHWLTAVFILGLLGLGIYFSSHFHKAQLKLQEIRATRAELDSRLKEAHQLNQKLQQQLSKATDKDHMELMAKTMGFIYPHETVYQTTISPKR